jgi:hypothetical protein
MNLTRPFRLFLLLLLLSAVCPAYAQTITLSGRVTDAKTGEPIPFTNVTIVGKFMGTATDTAGYYSFQAPKKTDSLQVSSIGYTTIKKPVQEGVSQTIDFELAFNEVALGEVVINPGENPADVLFRQMISVKDKHNIKNYSSLKYEAYTKYEVDLDNVSDKSLDKNLLLSQFPMLKGYLDTVTEKGSSILPMFFIENISDNYSTTNPDKQIEKVKGVKMSGLDKQDFVTELLSNVNQNVNIYENMITVLGKSFVSPVADYGLSVYKYYLNFYDTLYVNGEPHLQMEFKPKRRGENTFKGKMLVNINSYAVRSIEASLSDNVNIGFVHDISFQHDYTSIEYADTAGNIQQDWLPQREKLKIKFSSSFVKDAKLIGKKTKSFKNYAVNTSLSDTVFSAYKSTVISEDAYLKDDKYWQEMRHDTLQKTEAGIYEMVDSLTHTKRFRLLRYVAMSLTTGYARIGNKIGIGHVAGIVSGNQVEKVRFKLGFQTTEKFSQRVQLEGHVAYGLKDDRFKYGMKVLFICARKPWNKITVSGKSDIDFASRYAEEILDRDNVTSFLPRGVGQRLYNVAEGKIVYDRELHKDLTTNFSVNYKNLKPLFDFGYMMNDLLQKDITVTEFSVGIRYERGARVLPGTFSRDAEATKVFNQFRKKNPFPVLFVRYTYGAKNVVKSDFEYHDVSAGLQGKFQVSPKMSFYYNLWAGKIFGKLPFLLLKNPEGNFSYTHNKYFFNNMNLLEFSADEYISLNFQYFFGGLLLDKIPLIKKLKWRELVTTNIFYGNMSVANRNFNHLNTIDYAYPIPYVEAGVGVENIFKFIRLDCIWRLTHTDKADIIEFSPYLSFYIKI